MLTVPLNMLHIEKKHVFFYTWSIFFPMYNIFSGTVYKAYILILPVYDPHILNGDGCCANLF